MSSVEVFDARTQSGRVTRAELRERRLLQVHVLEHRLDDDVDLVEAVVAGRRRDERHRLLDLLGGHLALRHRDFVVLADRRQAALERRLVDFLQQHRDAGVRVGHRDAAAHRAGADDRGALDVRRSACPSGRRAPSRPRARRRTDGAAPSTRSRRRSRRTARARAPSPASKRSVSAGLDGVDGRERRAHALAPSSPAPRASARTPSSPAVDVVGVDRRSRASCGSRAPRALAFANAIAPSSRSPSTMSSMMPAACAFGAGTGLPSVHISSASVAPHEPRQPLRAAGAGNDAEQHFGLADLRVLRGDAVVAGHARPRGRRRARCRGSPRRAAWRRPRCRLSSACVPADRASDCSRVFSVSKTLMSAPAMNVVPAPISTMASAPASASRARDGLVDRLPDARAERVDRRVVDGQDGDAVLHVVANEIRHDDSRLQTQVPSVHGSSVRAVLDDDARRRAVRVELAGCVDDAAFGRRGAAADVDDVRFAAQLRRPRVVSGRV